jgi:hypothetical protein
LFIKYNFKEEWEQTHRMLNNFVHSNGLFYQQQNSASDNDINIMLCIAKLLNRIISMFVSILAVINARVLLVSKKQSGPTEHDIMDYLTGGTPNDNLSADIEPCVSVCLNELCKEIHPDLPIYLTRVLKETINIELE